MPEDKGTTPPKEVPKPQYNIMLEGQVLNLVEGLSADEIAQITERRGPMLNHIFPMTKQLVTLGRDAANDIRIDDPEVSRYHLRLKWAGQYYTVEDLGSTNGTRINGGARISGEVPLQAGNILMLGDTIALSYEFVP